MATKRHKRRRELKAAIFYLAALCAPSTMVFAQGTAVPPVLTVCEALRDINLYRGKVVVIVGHSYYTFDGRFFQEKCDPDDHILIQGHRWLSMIALGAEKPTSPSEIFPVGEGVLRERLSTLKEYRDEAQAQRGAEAKGPAVREGLVTLRWEEWVAVYGTLECPAKLRPHVPPSASNSRNVPGNGYGANGSVPAMIQVLRSKALPPSG
jgi:hypothetical protein